jgi:hypothetical protein
MMLSRSREKFRSARHQILILQPLENCRTHEPLVVSRIWALDQEFWIQR